MPAVGSVCNACTVGSLHSRCSTPVPPTCSPGGRVHLNSRRPCGLAEQQLAIGEAQMSAEPAVVQLEALMAKTDARKRLGDGLTAWQNSANLFQCATYAQNSMPECHCQLWMAPRRFRYWESYPLPGRCDGELQTRRRQAAQSRARRTGLQNG